MSATMMVDSRLLRVERLVRDNPARHRDGCTPTVSVPRAEARVPTRSRLAYRCTRAHAGARQEYAAEERPPLQLRSLDSVALVGLKQVRERSEKIRVESPSQSRQYRIRFQR